MSDRPDQSVWEAGWAGHEMRQRERMAQWTFVDRLRWLEQAHRLALRLLATAAREATRPPGDDENCRST